MSQDSSNTGRQLSGHLEELRKGWERDDQLIQDDFGQDASNCISIFQNIIGEARKVLHSNKANSPSRGLPPEGKDVDGIPLEEETRYFQDGLVLTKSIELLIVYQFGSEIEFSLFASLFLCFFLNFSGSS